MAEPKKRGRPRGSKNRVDHATQMVREAIPQVISRRRAPEETWQGRRYISSLQLDAISHLCLKIHAQRRGVPLAWLIQDLLNLWLAASTDYDQAIFKEMLPQRARAARCPERFAGYVESLGFAEAPQAPIPQPLPPAQAIEYVPMPGQGPTIEHAPSAQAPTLGDMTRPYVHPMASQGRPSYPHPEPALPHGALPFNPEEHNRIAPHPGSGSSAQDITEGRTPQAELPALNPDVEKWREHYRVDPKELR